MNKTCALICAYNEEESIFDVIEKTKRYVKDVYVIDDGSTDRTREISLLAGARVLSHPANKGKGAALKTGFSHVVDKDYDIIITLDADGQHLPEEIPFFIDRISQGFDVVVGKRNFSHKSMPIQRKLTNKIYSQILSMRSRTRIYDPQCGFRAFRREILEKLIKTSESRGFPYEVEMLLKLAGEKASIGWIEISTVYLDGRKSKIKPFRHLLDSTRVCLSCLLNL